MTVWAYYRSSWPFMERRLNELLRYPSTLSMACEKYTSVHEHLWPAVKQSLAYDNVH
jgi:hypothetical protein